MGRPSRAARTWTARVTLACLALGVTGLFLSVWYPAVLVPAFVFGAAAGVGLAGTGTAYVMRRAGGGE